MASSQVKAAIEARLALWSGISSCPFFDENSVAAAPKTQYLTVEYPVANEDLVGICQWPVETGAVRFVIHVLNMSGLDAGMVLADSLRDWFRAQTLGRVKTFEAHPVAFDKSNRAGAFYLLPFVVRYRFDLPR